MTPFLLALCLGSNDFDTRERAEACLAAAWPLSRPACQWARNSADPEVACRATRVLDRFSAFGGSYETSLLVRSFLGLPYSDSLPVEVGVRKYQTVAARGLMARGVPVGGPLWLDYRYATRLWLESEWCGDTMTLAIMLARSQFYDANGRYP